MPNTPLVPPGSPLRRLRGLPKLVRKNLCILLVQNNYHVQRECRRALVGLGHTVVPLVIGENGSSQQPCDNVDMFLRAVITHRPDMMLTIDALVFDRVNWMAEVVDAVGLPTAIWHVDSPLFVGRGFLNPAPEWTTTFSWDRSYVPILASLGVPRVHHLPLATDPSVFTPGPLATEKMYPMGFVGNSLTDLIDRWRSRLTPDEQLQAHSLHQALLADRQTMCAAAAKAGPPIDRGMLRLAYANFMASQTYRLGLLQALPQSQLHVFGDAAWQTLLPKAHAHAGFAYGRPLAEVFRATGVNINATNLQMPATVNQRVFDVPACGGLLLTDRQTELDRYFIPGEEVLTYSSADEAADLAAYHSTNPKQAAPLVARARQRVLAEHTYTHRLAKLLRIMRQHHAHGYRPPGHFKHTQVKAHQDGHLPAEMSPPGVRSTRP